MTDKMSRGLSGYKYVEGEPTEKYVGKRNALTVKVDVDVSEALTGLKALQREAKKATQAIRELETEIPVDLTKVPTCELQRELEKREGVKTFVLPRYGHYANLRIVSEDGGYSEFIEGPAIVTVNVD